MSKWTEHNTKRCLDLWSEGYSASQIARVLGDGLTRSAVIGKIHRADLPPRTETPKNMPGLRVVRTPKPKAPVAAEQEPEVIGEPMDFPKRGCLWIPGEPNGQFRCCAQPRFGNTPYCETHAAKAYQPARNESR